MPGPCRVAGNRATTRVAPTSSLASLLRNLHVNPVGILDVQPGVVALQGSCTALRQIACRGFPAETRYPDREVIDDAGRASMVERDQHLGVAEANDSAWLVLANHREAEHLLIEVDGTLQVRDMNTDVIDVRGFEIDVFPGDCGGPTGSQHGEPAN